MKVLSAEYSAYRGQDRRIQKECDCMLASLLLIFTLSFFFVFPRTSSAQSRTEPAATSTAPAIPTNIYRDNIEKALADLHVELKVPPSSYAQMDNEDIFSTMSTAIKLGKLDIFDDASLLKFGFSKTSGVFERNQGSSRIFVSFVPGKAITVASVTWTPSTRSRLSEAVINALMSKSSSVNIYRPTEVEVTLSSGETPKNADKQGSYQHVISIGLDGMLNDMKITGSFVSPPPSR
jgi:hypothetical protein